MNGFKIGEWGGDTSELENASGALLYKTVILDWSPPTIWKKADRLPEFDNDEPFIYTLIRNHWRSTEKDHIEYVGLTSAPKTRFGNHPTARRIVQKRGEVKFSYAPVNFIKGRDKLKRISRALEEIEHLMIWTLYHNLENKKKMYTLPGMGTNPGNAWHIKNTGYRFSGQMPREIVYPWMLVKPGRNRTRRPELPS